MNSNQDINYQISFRLLNIKIEENLDISENISIRILTKEEIKQKYPLDKNLYRLSENEENHWFEHNCELVFNFYGNKKDIENNIKIELTNQIENRVLNSFILSGICEKQNPYATHWSLESSYRNILNTQGYRGMTFTPFLITKVELDKIKKSFKIITEAEKDKILDTSFERYFIAKQKRFQHIYKTNYPNWDKIVDYAIAFETIFLTPLQLELSYRFKLNGTSLISKTETRDKRIIFNALGELYKLRSKIVHGGNSESIRGQAKKLVKALSLNTENHEHDIGILIIICNQLDEWFFKIFELLSNLDINDRPYKKAEIWEDWLWDKK